MTSNFGTIPQMLNLPNVTEEVLEDMSLEKIEEGAKMFLYLNSCPSSFSLLLKKVLSSTNGYTVIMSLIKIL